MSSTQLNDLDYKQLLNSIGENLILANNELNIIWFNSSARKLLQKVGPYVGINNPQDFIGISIKQFHGSSQNEILQNGPFPHKASIQLFNRFAAEINVDIFYSTDEKKQGYILTWKDVTDYQDEVEAKNKLIEEMSVPIIETSIDTALLVPLSGTLTEQRLYTMREKVLSESSARSAETIIFDFTGIHTSLEENMSHSLNAIVSALKLMGVETIFVGLRPSLAQQIVLGEMDFKVKTFQSFKKCILHIWREKGYTLKKV
ncbi:STAS domain-containing protein [Bacillus lacus]|uniref:STAS domain-containing protein n=1 Tax=Metabacillus lacus TaxID=1983721 RepID=A0A7X2J2C7_9BACI|nr:STAS domain-containing protein [Metabacillus lacus]MRX74177.1 STAS domain-containing protein [Metabacillus lacus]